jgi:hypothetical protein
VNARQSWVLAAAVVLASLILGVSFGGRSAAQPKADAAAVGRYQIRQGSEKRLVVIDTVTGRCWGRDELGWNDLGSPAPGNR